MSTIPTFDDNNASTLDTLRAERARRNAREKSNTNYPTRDTGFQPVPSTSTNTKRPISPKKLAANRANAQKSTGPKTPQGKQRSARNALKHGPALSLSKGVCSSLTRLPEECEVAFATYCSELQSTLRPATPLQRLLFNQIATVRWRLDRLPEADTHLFHLQLQQLNDDDSHHHHSSFIAHHSTPISSSELLAHTFAAHPTHNGFLALERYERNLTSTLCKLMRLYNTEQKLRPTVADNPEEGDYRRHCEHDHLPSDLQPAWTLEMTRRQQLACLTARLANRDHPEPYDYPPRTHRVTDQELQEARSAVAALEQSARTLDHQPPAPTLTPAPPPSCLLPPASCLPPIEPTEVPPIEPTTPIPTPPPPIPPQPPTPETDETNPPRPPHSTLASCLPNPCKTRSMFDFHS